jgi:hypothetical protein
VWRLESRLGRLFKGLSEQRNWSDAKRRKNEEFLEKNLFQEFRKAYHRIPGASPLPPEEDNEFLAYAQHYSLPTRLLDWSRSPYIAAFFAFEGGETRVLSRDQPVAIWAINWRKMELLMYFAHYGTEPTGDSEEAPTDLADTLQVMRANNSPRP